MFPLSSPNSVTKVCVITVKGFESTTFYVRDQDATKKCQQDACEKQGL